MTKSNREYALEEWKKTIERERMLMEIADLRGKSELLTRIVEELLKIEINPRIKFPELK